MKKNIIKLPTFLLLFVALFLQSCYEDYKFDYTHTTSYFARQKPVRTLVESDNENLDFTFGTVLSGVYENNKNWNVNYEIAPELLKDYPNKVLLPSDYYTLSDDKNIVIPKGKLLGEIEVLINKEKFMSDPLALSGNYVLPIRIVKAETDSILEGKDYTLIALKYINKYHGYYWVKGKDVRYKGAGSEVIDEESYSSEDLVTNRRATLSTLSANSLKVSYVGRFNVNGYYMSLSIDKDNKVVMSNLNCPLVSDLSGNGTYDEKTKTFTLKYQYTDNEKNKHEVTENLIFSDLELKLEEWK